MSDAPRPSTGHPSAFAFFLQLNRLRLRPESSDGKPLSRDELTRAKHAMIFRPDEQYESD
ncbi:MAG TPA: hypothetical protein PJ993_00575 [Candidatus Saccharibacteria bacterium]|nr:hypothetical protein [Candidatus Saccharibacteria bacterium]HMT39421.1 hypothetical protein [Candidatus Saccharibacteria bacterium]